MFRNHLMTLAAFVAIGGATIAPVQAQKGDDWKNIAIASGLAGVLGLISHDNTLTFVGAGGALYSYWRYDQDRKSRNKAARLRAAYFAKGTFVRNGHTYKKRTVVKNGKKYYQFVRVS